MDRRAWIAGLAALTPALPLVKQFIPDSRLNVIKYSSTGYVGVTGLPPSEPYRHQDVALLLDNSGGAASWLEFRFSSQGQEDELLSAYGVAVEGNPILKIYLNKALIAEITPAGDYLTYSAVVRRFDPSRRYVPGADIYLDSMLSIAPPAGTNTLRIVKEPSTGRLYFDGFGCWLRGGPLA